jgi:hypothetical protein
MNIYGLSDTPCDLSAGAKAETAGSVISNHSLEHPIENIVNAIIKNFIVHH